MRGRATPGISSVQTECSSAVVSRRCWWRLSGEHSCRCGCSPGRAARAGTRAQLHPCPEQRGQPKEWRASSCACSLPFRRGGACRRSTASDYLSSFSSFQRLCRQKSERVGSPSSHGDCDGQAVDFHIKPLAQRAPLPAGRTCELSPLHLVCLLRRVTCVGTSEASPNPVERASSRWPRRSRAEPRRGGVLDGARRL
jgi:hypothetical protein